MASCRTRFYFSQVYLKAAKTPKNLIKTAAEFQTVNKRDVFTRQPGSFAFAKDNKAVVEGASSIPAATIRKPYAFAAARPAMAAACGPPEAAAAAAAAVLTTGTAAIPGKGCSASSRGTGLKPADENIHGGYH